MIRIVVVAVLPLVLLAACQTAPPSAAMKGRACTQRMIDAGQCDGNSISSFPELANVR